ncbi:MAG: nitroreductase family protein [Nanoarchaeota archaeon]|nr:nitroreductase family protein [Nanoarchaeota archaeon]
MAKNNLYNKITSKFTFNQPKSSPNLKKNNLNSQDKKNYQNINNENFSKSTIKNSQQETQESNSSKTYIEPSLQSYKELKIIIKNRRSIRQFTPYKPPYKIIFEILETCFYAPRAGNVMNSEIIIIEETSKKVTISNLCYQQSWIAQAPYIIVITSSKDDIQKLYPDISQRFSTQNTSAVIENFLLLIHSAGFASCWVQSFQEEVLKDYLGIPPNLEIHGIFPVGFAKEIPQKPINPDINMKISYEEYGNKNKQ